MKYNKLIPAALLAIGLAACTSDDTVVSNNSIAGEDGKAYLAVRIVTPSGSYTRTTTDEGYANGDATESADINSQLAFLFYDTSGNYVAYSQKTTTWSTQQSEDSNVETIGDAVVVLENLSSTDNPTQVICIVGDNNFASELKENNLSTALAKIYDKTTYADDNEFFMSNSTYLDGSNNVCCATQVTPDNFAESETLIDDAKPVEIYVERLAVKVEMGYGTELTLKDGLVELGSFTLTKYTDENTYEASQTTLYFKAKGWGLNATNKTAYALKNIDNSWSFNWTWNSTSDYRCFWEQTPNYGENKGKYPSDYDSSYNADDYSLSYTTYADLKGELGKAEYCLPNTNKPSVYNADGANKHAILTEALLAGQVGTVDENGNFTPMTVYKYGGKLYNGLGYMCQALRNAEYTPKYSESTDEDGNTTGTVTVTDNGTTYTAKIYTNTYNDQGDGYVYIKLTPDGDGDVIKVDEYGYCYQNGRMYYNVPIEHLAYTNAEEQGVEGEYGVVRNHWYQLSITKIENLGNAVAYVDPNNDPGDDPDPTDPDNPDPTNPDPDPDPEPTDPDNPQPDEPIIPQEDNTYYLSARINVLSWKVVKQGVEF